MEQLYTLTPNKKILLTASSSGLYAHHYQNDRFLRSSLLCSNYEQGLSGVLYNDALYYAYINKEQSLLLRCIGESSLQFRLDGTEAISYHAPRLAVFGGFLLLLYFECTGGAYQLRIRAPFADLPPITLPSFLPVSFAGLPDLGILPSEKHLYLLLCAGGSSFLFRYTTSFAPKILCSEEEFFSRLRPVRDAEKAEFMTQLQQAEQQATEQQELLTEKETKLQMLRTRLAEREANLHMQTMLLAEKDTELSDTKALLQQSKEQLHHVQNRLTECDAARREALQNLTHTSGLLERAKVQYGELMQIALQYKEEAAKWYGKFTDRH